jgi:hypothetical protein
MDNSVGDTKNGRLNPFALSYFSSSKVFGSIRRRLNSTYDLCLKDTREIPKFLFYLLKRMFAFENNRVNKTIKKCNSILEQSKKGAKREIDIKLLVEENPIDIAKNCHNRFGFYPISFISMRDINPKVATAEKRNLLSSVIPGSRYGFDSEEKLYEEYASSHFSFTFKKCGWDSYRTVEILSQGSIPIYLGIDSVPRFCMTFYPKRNIKLLTRKFLTAPYTLSQESKLEFLRFSWERLGAKFLGNYLFEMQNSIPQNVLFYDEHLDIFKGDYESMMVLKGLSSLPGVNVFTPQELTYLFDYSVDSSDLYGMGFGYKGMLEGSSVKKIGPNFKTVDFDLLVIGSVARNWNFLLGLEEKNKSKIILIWGEDHSPSRTELKLMREKSDHIFVREINHPFVIP